MDTDSQGNKWSSGYLNNWFLSLEFSIQCLHCLARCKDIFFFCGAIFHHAFHGVFDAEIPEDIVAVIPLQLTIVNTVPAVHDRTDVFL